MSEARLCRLQDLAGRVERCPESGCQFWEEGGTLLDGGCLWARLPLELERRRDLIQYLLELRLALDGRPLALGERSLFYRLRASAED